MLNQNHETSNCFALKKLEAIVGEKRDWWLIGFVGIFVIIDCFILSNQQYDYIPGLVVD